MSKITRMSASLGTDDFTFLTRKEYFRDLAARIHRTKRSDRVMVITHDFHPDEPLVADIMQALYDAAARGVQTHFAIDERSFPLMQRVPVNKRNQQLIRSTHTALKTLETAGGTYAITNKTFHRVINRFSGRAHIKLAIINDDIYVGGCNLTRAHHLDMMVRWHSPESVDWLHPQMKQVIETGNTWETLEGIDRELILDDNTRLLLDSGRPHQSIILDNALRLIDEAKEWIVITCQYFPNSITGKHLAAAHRRGVNVSIYYNHPSNHKVGFNMLVYATVLRERAKYPEELFAGQLHRYVPYVHAKLLASESSAMIGSHNFVAMGVSFGTAELTLFRRDPEFARQAVGHFRSQLVPFIDQFEHVGEWQVSEQAKSIAD